MSIYDYIESLNRYGFKNQQAQNKAGLFDQMGEGFQPAITPEQLLAFQRQQSYINNPDRISGVAGAGGEMLGNAIAALVNKKRNKGAPEPANAEASGNAALIGKMKEYIKAGKKPDEALYLAGTDFVQSDDPGMQQVGAKAVQFSTGAMKYDPSVQATRDSQTTSRPVTPEEIAAYHLDPANGYEAKINKEGKITDLQQVSGRVLTGTPADFAGTKAQLGEQIEDLRSTAINNDQAIQSIDTITGRIDKDAGTAGYTGRFVNTINNAFSTAKGVGGILFKNTEATQDFANYVNSKLPSEFMKTAGGAALNMAAFNKLAYMVALSNQNGSNKITQQDFDTAQQQVGAAMSNPETAKQIMAQLRNDLINRVHLKVEYSQDIMKSPAAIGIYGTFSKKYPKVPTINPNNKVIDWNDLPN